MELTDAVTAAYQHKPMGVAVFRAQGFLNSIKNHILMLTLTAAVDRGQQPTEPPELVDERYAAREILKVSERTLWTLREQGAIPHIRIGHSVRYNLDDLRRWIEANKQHGKHRNR
jgi:excisionase family DNA binding protein